MSTNNSESVFGSYEHSAGFRAFVSELLQRHHRPYRSRSCQRANALQFETGWSFAALVTTGEDGPEIYISDKGATAKPLKFGWEKVDEAASYLDRAYDQAKPTDIPDEMH